MNSTLRISVVLAAALALSACGTAYQGGQKQGLGTLIGGAAGAVAGAQFGNGTGRLVMTALGTLAGAAIGNSFGESLDRADRQYAGRAQQVALEHKPTGSQTTWHNPDTGNYGTIKPTQTYRSPRGEYCREYQHTVVIGGHTQDAYGRACRQPDGSWEIRNES
ncbi:MAG: RT0821/Lpp0805 family surface protein [Alphaproteobacteria bacterium]